MRFLQPAKHTKKNLIDLTKEYLEQINKIKKDWKLEFYPQFMNMTIQELNIFSGAFKSKKELSINDKFRFKNKEFKKYKVHKLKIKNSFKKKQQIKALYAK